MITNAQRISNAIDQWLSTLIDELMPDTSLRYRAKRGISKIIHDKLNIEMIVPFLEDDAGNLDIDNLSTELMEMLATLPPQNMSIGPVEVEFSGKDVRIAWPKNIITTMLMGEIGSVRLNAEDISQLVELIKQQ